MTVLEKLSRLSEARSRASEKSARRREPMRQRRVQAFVDAMRADPDGGPKAWSAAVAQQELGRTATYRNIESLRRWFHLRRTKIETALIEETPPEIPPVPPEQ